MIVDNACFAGVVAVVFVDSSSLLIVVAIVVEKIVVFENKETLRKLNL